MYPTETDRPDDLFDDEEPTADPTTSDTIDFRIGDTATPLSPARRHPRKHRTRRVITWIALIAGVAARHDRISPLLQSYAVEAQIISRITSLEKRGLIFKTYEGSIRQADTDSVMTFSVESEALARHRRCRGRRPTRHTHLREILRHPALARRIAPRGHRHPLTRTLLRSRNIYFSTHSVVWPIFVRLFGRFSFGCLADFHSVVWPNAVIHVATPPTSAAVCSPDKAI